MELRHLLMPTISTMMRMPGGTVIDLYVPSAWSKEITTVSVVSLVSKKPGAANNK
jgi:hypothetical protein